MFMMFNHPTKGRSLGLLYDVPAVPEHLHTFLENNTNVRVYDLAAWFHVHNVKGVAYCAGNWIDKIKSHRFIKRFNREMQKYGMLAGLGEFYYAVINTKKRR